MLLRKVNYFNRTRRQILIVLTTVSFLFNFLVPISYAQMTALMPQAGTLVTVSDSFAPAILKGVMPDPKDPLKFDFFCSYRRPGAWV